MEIETYKIQKKTKGFCDIMDITPDAKRFLDTSGLKEGMALLFVKGYTARLKTVKNESGIIHDLEILF